MLDRLEKIECAFGGLLVLAVVFLFFYPGLSAPVSDVPSPSRVFGKPKEFTEGLSAAAAEKHAKESMQASQGAKISAGAGQAPKQEYFAVPKEEVQRLADKRHVVTELDKAASKLDAKRRELTITNITEGSLLKSYGFQAGDVIKGLNGKAIPFDDQAAMWGLYDEQMERLARGEAIIVTLERQGRPVLFHFKPDDVEGLLKLK